MKPWILRQSFEQKSCTFVAIFDIEPKITHFCRDFVSEGWNIPEKSFPGKKFLVRNFVLQEEIFCLREKFPVTGRYYLSNEEIYRNRGKFPVKGRNFIWKKEISYHRKKFPVTGRHFLLRDDLSLHWTKFSVTGNKPSFCSGSCDEWHATINFQKQDNLETLSKVLETSLKHIGTYLKYLWNFHNISLKLLWNTLESILDPPGTSLKPS